MFFDNIDLFLFIALIFDLLSKKVKIDKIKKQMRKWKRYQLNTTKMKYILYGMTLFLSFVYIGFRIYTLIRLKGEYLFPKVMLIIPIIDYYVLYDWFLAGIYYNNSSIYYKNEYYEYKNAKYIYRDVIKNHYEYEVIYQMPQAGERTFTIRIPNQKEAFDLLASIPFIEDERRK